MRFLDTWRLSWELATNSFGVLRNNKLLIIFPILSILAMALVSVSMLGTGVLGDTQEIAANDQEADWVFYMELFLFYFFNYLVMIFFNTALIACTMQALQGYQVDLMYGISISVKRLPQIVGWAVVASVVGVALKMLERKKKISSFISQILGMAWAAFTFFAVPFIVVEGVNPVAAIKKSSGLITKHWGKAVMCDLSIGFIGFVVALPLVLLAIAVMYFSFGFGSTPAVIAGIGVVVFIIFIAAAISTALDTICKTLLFCHVTGKTLPENVDTGSFDSVFSAR